MKKQVSLENGQVMILIAIGFAILLGFVALAVDGGMLYSDRRQAQNAADAAALAGGGAAATSIENNKLFYSSWNCSDPRIAAVRQAAVAAAIQQAAEYGSTLTASGVPGDNVVVATCGQDSKNGLVNKYFEVSTYISHTTTTSFLQLLAGDSLSSHVQASSRVYPRSPLVYGNAVVALNPQNCQGQQNGLTILEQPTPAWQAEVCSQMAVCGRWAMRRLL